MSDVKGQILGCLSHFRIFIFVCSSLELHSSFPIVYVDPRRSDRRVQEMKRTRQSRQI